MKINRPSLRTFRRRLASIDSVPQFALLGIASGLVTGLVIIAFRLAIDYPLRFFMHGGSENFESLDIAWAVSLPIVGAVIIAAFLAFFDASDRRIGVLHVLERLARHQGHMPLKPALIQFIGGVIALATGQSGGREGPAVHLGAAGSSLIGRSMKLPNNSIRVLAGCGAAAAISASFNTPIAGVIFSMEVIVMEYTIAGFIPVILASVVAALLTQMVFGAATAFEVPPVSMASLYDLPVLVVEGIFIGAVAGIFIHLVRKIHEYSPPAFWARLMIAGGLTGAAAAVSPQILGIGYDSVNHALAGELAIMVLVTAFLLKTVASAAVTALGMPVGVIGPTLFIGAMGGGIFAVSAANLGPDVSEDSLYVMLGMGAMMGAVLQAPLAALMAVLELTNNANIILPAMLVIIIANMTASQIFGARSIFIMQMEMLGLEWRQNPLSMTLNRASVASIMIRSFQRVDMQIDSDKANELLRENPLWLLVNGEKGPSFILRTEDLDAFLKDNSPGETSAGDTDSAKKEETIDLAAIPATRKDVTSVYLQATLSEALEALNKSGVQALYVNRISAPLIDAPVGLVTREDIESYYQGT